MIGTGRNGRNPWAYAIDYPTEIAKQEHHLAQLANLQALGLVCPDDHPAGYAFGALDMVFDHARGARARDALGASDGAIVALALLCDCAAPAWCADVAPDWTAGRALESTIAAIDAAPYLPTLAQITETGRACRRRIATYRRKMRADTAVAS